jgi:hypothetical protein
LIVVVQFCFHTDDLLISIDHNWCHHAFNSTNLKQQRVVATVALESIEVRCTLAECLNPPGLFT